MAMFTVTVGGITEPDRSLLPPHTVWMVLALHREGLHHHHRLVNGIMTLLTELQRGRSGLLLFFELKVVVYVETLLSPPLKLYVLTFLGVCCVASCHLYHTLPKISSLLEIYLIKEQTVIWACCLCLIFGRAFSRGRSYWLIRQFTINVCFCEALY